MSWVRADDGFPDHPKFLKAGPVAGYFNLAAIAWSNRNGTDGKVPKEQLGRLVAGLERIRIDGKKVNAVDLAIRLVDVGLWERLDEGDFRIHDYLDYQLSVAEMKRRAEQKSKAGKKGAEAKWAGKRDGKPMAGAMAGVTAPTWQKRWQNDGPTPTPTPTPKTSEEEVPESADEFFARKKAQIREELEEEAAKGSIWHQAILDSEEREA